MKKSHFTIFCLRKIVLINFSINTKNKQNTIAILHATALSNTNLLRRSITAVGGGMKIACTQILSSSLASKAASASGDLPSTKNPLRHLRLKPTFSVLDGVVASLGTPTWRRNTASRASQCCQRVSAAAAP